MSVYVVTWNLNGEGARYNEKRTQLLQQISRYENTRDSQLETVRFISTTESAYEVDEHLRKKMDTNDRLFVSRLNRGENQGWLDPDVWKWINARL
jgi:hypothetical protein